MSWGQRIVTVKLTVAQAAAVLTSLSEHLAGDPDSWGAATGKSTAAADDELARMAGAQHRIWAALDALGTRRPSS